LHTKEAEPRPTARTEQHFPHPLELFADVAWETYCPVARLGEHVGETVVTCGLVLEQRTQYQITGEATHVGYGSGDAKQ
jgi:hypothetical protein